MADVQEFHDSISTLKSNIETLLNENKALKQKNKDNLADWEMKNDDLNEKIEKLNEELTQK